MTGEDGFVPDQEDDGFVEETAAPVATQEPAGDGFVEDKEKSPQFFEGVRQFFIETKKKVEELFAQRQQAQAAEQQKIAEEDANPATWSSSRFRKEAPKPQTMEEQAIYDTVLKQKTEQEKALAGLLGGAEAKIEAQPEKTGFAGMLEHLKDFYRPNLTTEQMKDELSKEFGLSRQEVDRNFDALARKKAMAAGVATQPTNEEFLNAVMLGTLPIAASISGPMAVAKGIASYMGVKEGAERVILPGARAVWQAINQEPVKYEVTKLRDLVPDNPILKNTADLSEFLIYGIGAKPVNEFLNSEAAGKLGERALGELAGIRYRILKAMGIKQETALVPLTDEQIKTAFGESAWKYLSKEGQAKWKAEQTAQRAQGEGTTTQGETATRPEVKLEVPAEDGFVPETAESKVPTPINEKTYYSGSYEGKPVGESLYLTENPNYAKNFGDVVTPYKIKVENPLDLTMYKERSIPFEKAAETLKQSGVDVPAIQDDVEKPLWMWVRKYPEIARAIKTAGFDSVIHSETFTGKGKKETTIQVLDPSKAQVQTAPDSSKSYEVFHVSGTSFDQFNDALRGSITGAKSAKGAIWFTDNERVAKAYSVYAAETGPVSQKLREADAAEKIAQRTGKKADWDKYDALVREAEALDTYEQQLARREKATVKKATIKGNFLEVDAGGKTPQEFSADEDIDSWLNEQIKKAKAAGKDGLVIKNLDDAVGLDNAPSTHYAVFSTKSIKTEPSLPEELSLEKPAIMEKVKELNNDAERLIEQNPELKDAFPGGIEEAVNSLPSETLRGIEKESLGDVLATLRGGSELEGIGGESGVQPVKEEFDTHEMSAQEWGKNLTREEKASGRINKTEIVRWTEEAFGVPVRSKLTHLMKKAAGFYKTKEQLIRLKKWGELEVLTHEAAHQIDFGLITPKAGDGWRTKNIPAGQKARAASELASLDYDQNQRRGYEGWAEYIRHWVTDTGQAQRLAPTFTKFFEGDFKKLYPDIAANLEKMREMYRTWDKQGAVARVLGHVDFKGEHSQLPISKKIAGLTDWMRKQFIDEFYLLKDIETELGIESRKGVRPTKSPYEMATYMKQKATGIARTFVTEAAVDEYGHPIGKSLVEILGPVVSMKDVAELMKPGFLRTHEGTKLGEFIAYWIALRAKTLGSRGIESGFDSGDVDYILEKFKNPDFDKVAKELTEWSDHLVDWVARAGGFRPGTTDLFRALNPIYVPFKRAFIEEAGTTGVGKLFSRSTGVMSIKGSGRPIMNPFESLIKSASELITKAHKVRLSNLIADLSKVEGAGKWVSKIPLATKVTEVSMSKVLDRLFAELIKDGQEIPDMDSMKDEMLTIFGKTSKYSKKGNVVAVFRDGNLELYELHPDLYSTLQGLEPIQLNALTRLLSPFTRFLRLGATGINAAFGLIRNPIRDFLTAGLFSKSKTFTPLHPLKGVVHELTAKPGSPAARFKAAGGDISSQMGYDRAQTMAVYDEALVKALGKTGKVLYVAKHPIDTLRRLVNIPEMGPRIAELEASMERYRKEHPEWSDDDVFVAAFNDAQDVTINFSRSGKIGKQINQAVFAFNAVVQGPNKFFRSMRENPFRTVTRGLVWLSLAAIAAWYYAKDKTWYKNLPPAYRYNNLFFEMPDGNVLRVPMPYDIGVVFSALPMAMLDAYYEKDPDLYKGVIDLAVSQVPNPLDISAISPVWDVASNKDYMSRPIESETMKRLPSEERKFDWTPAYAKELSKGFNGLGVELSPVQIAYLMNSYTGGIAGRGFGEKSEGPADIPVVGTLFTRDNSRPKYQLDKFFTRLRDVEEKKVAGTLTENNDRRDYLKYTRFHKNVVSPLMKRARQFREKGQDGTVEKINELLAKRLNSFLEDDRKQNEPS